ncbi:hypothetical protein M3Y99_00784200 [Aphelenchoides fujianensis]|nr:hypothetical protein M3Y99_00784200 [Aphelenchoides fujianensis]
MANQAKETEFRRLMEDFQDHHEERDYNPLPLLVKIAEVLEWANEEYFAHNPDPLDTRHPMRVLPDCALGYMLRHLHRGTDFFDKAMVSYLMPHERSEVNVMAARVLVSALPIMDPSCFTTDVIKELYNYALNSESRELRAYSTILLNAAMTPENAHTYRGNIVAEQMTNKETPAEGTAGLPTDFSGVLQNEANEQSSSGSTGGVQPAANGETPTTPKTPPNSRIAGLFRKRSQPPAADDSPPTEIAPKRAKTTPRGDKQVLADPNRRVNGASTPLVDSFNDGASNCSSTIDDIRRIIVGNNRIYPLTIEMEQRMILQFLQSVCEFTDHLSVLVDHNALEMVMKYLNVAEYNDIRLLFEALYCMGTLLIHLRLAWDFVSKNGLSKLIAVNRRSVAAAAVCVCLHHISQFDDVMATICESPPKLLDDLMEYAIWQLGQGYESSSARTCGFLGYALQFKLLLERFEHQDGLRVLYNYASARLNEYLDLDTFEDYERLQDKLPEYGSILRNTCTALQRYMMSHIVLKYEAIKRHHPNLQLPNLKFHASGRMPLKDLNKKPLILEPDVEKKALELLLNVLPSGSSWHPANAIRHLGFVTLFLRIIGIRLVAQHHLGSSKQDATKACLNVLRYATVSPGVVKDICETISFKEHNTSGIGILLDLIESDPAEDPETIKIVLSILAHCFCGPLPSEAISTPKVDKFRSPADVQASAHRRIKAYRYFQEDGRPEGVLANAWECAQKTNAIMATKGDAMRAMACRALVGLCRSEPVRQLVSRLPLIANNEITMLMREPLMQDKLAEHAEFRRMACKLLEVIHQTPIEPNVQDLTIEKVWKAGVIKQTKIRFDETELLKLIQDHLKAKGMNKTAEMLEEEAGPLNHMSVTAPRSSVVPKQLTVDGGGIPRQVGLRRRCDLRREHVGQVAPASASSSTNSVSSVQSPPKSTIAPLIRTPPTGRARRALPFSITRPSTLGRTVAEVKRRSVNTSSLLAQPALPFSGRHAENFSAPRHSFMVKPHKSLDEIVSEYFRNQHAQCERPIVTCPPFSFYMPHKCPKPKDLFAAPINVVERFAMRQALPHGQTHRRLNRGDRNLAYSHFCPIRFVDLEDEKLTACSFSYNDEHIHLGTYSGDVHWINSDSMITESSITCHSSAVCGVGQSTDGGLMVTSSLFVRPYSALWRLNDTQELVKEFTETTELDFGRTSSERLIGNERYTAIVFDTETTTPICKLYDPTIANKYSNNKALFNSQDNVILNDGILWDLRASESGSVIHKFDKFSNVYAAAFHPSELEVLICGQVVRRSAKGGD